MRIAIAVVVTIAKHEDGRCRYLERDRRLGSTRSCRLYTLLRASGKYSLARHRIDWTLPVGHKLPPGSYQVVAAGVDQSGNIEHAGAKSNRKSFTLKKSSRRSSGQR